MVMCHLPAQGQSKIADTVNNEMNIIDPVMATRMTQQFKHVL